MKTLNEIINFFYDEEYEMKSKRVSEEYFEDLLDYANNGAIEAQLMVHVLYSEGMYVEQNDNKAKRWIEKMVKRLDSGEKIKLSSPPVSGNASELFGDLKEIFSGIYVAYAMIKNGDKKYEEANKYFKKSLEYCADIEAYFHLGENYYFGYGVKENEDTALKYFQKLNPTGLPDEEGFRSFKMTIYRYMGLIYYNKNDYNNALFYFKNGAALEDEVCQYFAGVIFEEKDMFKKSVKYYLEAAKNGNIDSLIHVGRCYSRGILGFEENTNLAIEYLTKAIDAETDDAGPYVDLCYIYSCSMYGHYDPEKGIKYGEYALNNCEFYSENDLIVYIHLAFAYDALENYDMALAYAQKAKEYGLEDADECYDEIIKNKRGFKIFGFIDKLVDNPLVDLIPGINLVAKSYKLGSKIEESLNNKDFNSFTDSAIEAKNLFFDNDDD